MLEKNANKLFKKFILLWFLQAVYIFFVKTDKSYFFRDIFSVKVDFRHSRRSSPKSDRLTEVSEQNQDSVDWTTTDALFNALICPIPRVLVLVEDPGRPRRTQKDPFTLGRPQTKRRNHQINGP